MNYKYSKRQKPLPFWWAHKANADFFLSGTDEIKAAVFTQGEGIDAAYCVVKQTGKGISYWCDDNRWHLEHEIQDAPQIDGRR